MTARSWVNGNAVFYRDDDWEYRLTSEEVDPKNPLPCPRCGLLPDEDGHDGCLGHVQGAWSACCGHGVTDPYALYHLGGEALEDNDDLDLVGLLDGKVRITRYQKGQIAFDQTFGLEMAEAYFSRVAPGLPFPKVLLSRTTPIADPQNRYILEEVNIIARDANGEEVTFMPNTNIEGYERYQRIENDAQRVYAQRMVVAINPEDKELRALFPSQTFQFWAVIDEGKLAAWPLVLFENTFVPVEKSEPACQG